jgi:hypothetical protein
LGLLGEDTALANRFLRSQVESIRKPIEEHISIQGKVSPSTSLPLSGGSGGLHAAASLPLFPAVAVRRNVTRLGTDAGPSRMSGNSRRACADQMRCFGRRAVHLAARSNRLGRNTRRASLLPQRRARTGRAWPRTRLFVRLAGFSRPTRWRRLERILPLNKVGYTRRQIRV